MDGEADRRPVSLSGLAIAFLIPLAVVVLAAGLVAQAGPHEVVLRGIPPEVLGRLEALPESEAAVPKDEAIARAIGGIPRDSRGARVGQIALGRYPSDFESDPLRGRLVWVVSFANPDDVGSGFVSGGFERDRSCDWSIHIDYVFVVIDAMTGEFVTSGEGGRFDPSRPPRSGEFKVTQEERERCERFFERQRALAESLTP